MKIRSLLSLFASLAVMAALPGIAAAANPNQSLAGLYLGTGSDDDDDTAAVWKYDDKNGVWSQLSPNLGDVVTDLVVHQNTMYAAVYDADTYQTQVCYPWGCWTRYYDSAFIYRYDPEAGSWNVVGGDLSGYSYDYTYCRNGYCWDRSGDFPADRSADVYVNDMVVHGNDLYAATLDDWDGGRLLRLDGDSWTVVAELYGDIDWKIYGVNALRADGPYIYYGDFAYDVIGRYDTRTGEYGLVMDFGGSCIFDIERYGNSLFASALEGFLYASDDGGDNWYIYDEPSPNAEWSGDVWEMETFRSDLYFTRVPTRIDGTAYAEVGGTGDGCRRWVLAMGDGTGDGYSGRWDLAPPPDRHAGVGGTGGGAGGVALAAATRANLQYLRRVLHLSVCSSWRALTAILPAASGARFLQTLRPPESSFNHEFCPVADFATESPRIACGDWEDVAIPRTYRRKLTSAEGPSAAWRA